MRAAFTEIGVYDAGRIVSLTQAPLSDKLIRKFSDCLFLSPDSVFPSTESEAAGVFLSGVGKDRSDLSHIVLLPGFADVHVHLREPGFSYKETIRTGTAAAARGGYTAVCAMPNLSPPPDGDAGLAAEEAAIRAGARIAVYLYGTQTVGRHGGEKADFNAMSGRVCGISDDGSGVPDKALMRSIMTDAASLGLTVVSHCEDTAYPGEDPRSEWSQVGRDLELAAETGCRFHVCHVSSAKSLSLIREAKRSGVDVSCESAPHYLLFDESDVRDDGSWRMNPPLRTRADREALLEGIADGTVDMIATDHAPHTAKEKGKGYAGSASGVVGLETAFPVLYTGLVLGGIITLCDLVRLISTSPRRRFGLPGGETAGDGAGWCAVDLDAKYTIKGKDFMSMGRSTPFEGRSVNGRILRTVYKGETVWQTE